jgi:hypothetical protein
MVFGHLLAERTLGLLMGLAGLGHACAHGSLRHTSNRHDRPRSQRAPTPAHRHETADILESRSTSPGARVPIGSDCPVARIRDLRPSPWSRVGGSVWAGERIRRIRRSVPWLALVAGGWCLHARRRAAHRSSRLPGVTPTPPVGAVSLDRSSRGRAGPDSTTLMVMAIVTRVHGRAGYRCRHGRSSVCPSADGVRVRNLYRREDWLVKQIAGRLGPVENDLPGRALGSDDVAAGIRARGMTIICQADGRGVTVVGADSACPGGPR